MKQTLALLPLLLFVERAEADTCNRWVNLLHPCDGLVAQNVCNNPDEWTPNQWISYKNWIYSSSPEEACGKYVMKVDPGAEWDVIRVDDNFYDCYYDWNDDGLDGDDWSATVNTVERRAITKDSCCSLVPNGRYGDNLGFSTIKTGGQFTKEQREDIIDLNKGSIAYVRGDAYRAGVTDPGLGAYGTLKTTTATWDYPDDPMPLGTLFHEAPAGGDAQVDHIIPRVDTNGCPCGDNSFRNAAVISAELNASMGRSCLDPRRIKFLQEWTLPAGSTPRIGDAPEIDESEQSVATGGCTAAGGGAGSMLLLLALFAIDRSRSARRS